MPQVFHGSPTDDYRRAQYDKLEVEAAARFDKILTLERENAQLQRKNRELVRLARDLIDLMDRVCSRAHLAVEGEEAA